MSYLNFEKNYFQIFPRVKHVLLLKFVSKANAVITISFLFHK